MKRYIFILFLVSIQVFPVTYFSHLSNAWYPNKSKQLRRKLDFLEDKVSKNLLVSLNPEKIKAILVPHASYDYSGVVAASAYQVLKNSKFKRIFIVGPSHYVPFQGVALLEKKYEKFGNEAGSISLDLKTLKKLRNDESGLFKVVQRAYDLEHSIEMQIPFIQAYSSSSKIIPLLLGELSHQDMDQLANILRSIADDETLFVFTSDLTHFGKSFSYVPFDRDISDNITNLDQRIVKSIQSLDRKNFEEVLYSTGATICGAGPIKLLLALYENSFSTVYVTGYDRSTKESSPTHSVSYVSLVVSSEKKSEIPLNYQLTGYEKMVLKKLAEQTLKNLFLKNWKCSSSFYILTETLHDQDGVFVTLNDKNHKLRGCIGRITSHQPLYESVCAMTRAAALEDLRFNPVRESEIADLSVEISILTYPQEIDMYKKIKIGTDGIILKYKDRSSIFLPQVPVEQGWNLEKTLEELSKKAGLQSTDYQNEDATFEIFQALKIV